MIFSTAAREDSSAFCFQPFGIATQNNPHITPLPSSPVPLSIQADFSEPSGNSVRGKSTTLISPHAVSHH
nr:MAG TPA: hypothetical protein [Caudoviricetes sp.]